MRRSSEVQTHLTLSEYRYLLRGCLLHLTVLKNTSKPSGCTLRCSSIRNTLYLLCILRADNLRYCWQDKDFLMTNTYTYIYMYKGGKPDCYGDIQLYLPRGSECDEVAFIHVSKHIQGLTSYENGNCSSTNLLIQRGL